VSDDNSMLVAGLAQRVVGQIEQATGLKKELLDTQRHAARMDDSHGMRLNLNIEREENGKLREALAQKEALLKEWMHSSEAFKRLARKYAEKVGVRDEQRHMDFNEQIVETGKEDPRFADTRLGKKAQEFLAEKSNGKP